MDGWTDVTKPAVAMRGSSAKAPKNDLDFTWLDIGKQIGEESFLQNNSFTASVKLHVCFLTVISWIPARLRRKNSVPSK